MGELGNSQRWRAIDEKTLKGLFKKKVTALDAVDGILTLDKLVKTRDQEMPPDWTIYMRIFGAPLTTKTDLMLFLAQYGIGGLEPARIIGVETDTIVDEKRWGTAKAWDREEVSREVPPIIYNLSRNKRLVILEGVYSAVFHPLGLNFPVEGTDKRYSMDIEVKSVSDYSIRKKRAIRRDGNTFKITQWEEILFYWVTPFDGRDMVISTDLAENAVLLEEKIGQLCTQKQITEHQLTFLRAYKEFNMKMIEYFERRKTR